MSQCIHCGRRIWFWQRIGFVVMGNGNVIKWHAKCRLGSRR
jgi:hypothetical protein